MRTAVFHGAGQKLAVERACRVRLLVSARSGSGSGSIRDCSGESRHSSPSPAALAGPHPSTQFLGPLLWRHRPRVSAGRWLRRSANLTRLSVGMGLGVAVIPAAIDRALFEAGGIEPVRHARILK